MDISLFDDFSYVALGHLHRPQMLGAPTRRYSGSPLAYSFSEEHVKQVVIIDIDPSGVCDVHEIPVPVGRGVATIVGTMSDLLDTASHQSVVDRFIRAVVTDAGHVVDAKAHLRSRFQHIIEVVLQPSLGSGQHGEAVATAQRALLSPIEAATSFWYEVTDAAPDPSEQSLLESVLGQASSEATSE